MTDREAEWVLAPKEPTEAMARDGAQELAMTRQRVQTAERSAEDIWSAMLAASPPAPISDEVVGGSVANLRQLQNVPEYHRMTKWGRKVVDDAVEAIERLATLPAPVSPPETDAVGAAERQVGQAVYLRIEALMDAQPGTPEGDELAYLAELASSVEEYGAWDGPEYSVVVASLPVSPPASLVGAVEALEELPQTLRGQANASQMEGRAAAYGSFTRGQSVGEVRAYTHAAKLVEAALRSPSPTREEVATIIREHVSEAFEGSISEAADEILTLFGRVG